MHKFLQNKLWRDKMPDIKRSMGSVIHTLKLDDEEYDRQLRIKLTEETAEVCVAKSRSELIEELADVFEVIDALCAVHKISAEDIDVVQTTKRQEKGGFYERAFVTVAEHPVGSSGELYCRAQPDKYPEIIEQDTE